MTNKRPPGREFQEMVAAIRKAVAPRGHTVTSPMYITDQVTKKLREHDVVIDCETGGFRFRIAMEARDRGKKVGVGAVEEFKSKCADTGIDRGIIVSSKGFWDTAIAKANDYGIGCQTLGAATGSDWCQALFLTLRTRNAEDSPRFNLVLAGDAAGAQDVLLADGSEWGVEARIALANQLVQGLPDDPSETPDVVYTKEVVVPSPGLLAVFADGHREPVQALLARLSYHTKLALIPFTFHSYRSQAGDGVNMEVATAEAPTAGQNGRVVLAKQPGGETTLTWVPD